MIRIARSFPIPEAHEFANATDLTSWAMDYAERKGCVMDAYVKSVSTDDTLEIIEDEDYTLRELKSDGWRSKHFELLDIKTYHGNCTIFGESNSLDIHYDSDTLDNYSRHPIYAEPYADEDEAIDTYKDDIRAEIEEAFPDAENIDDILDTIMIHAGSTINAMWTEEN